MKFLSALVVLFTASICAAFDGFADECLVPLAGDPNPLCPQITAFSDCYLNYKVSRDDSNSLDLTLNAMTTILDRFEDEQCDLNAMYNNECHEGFTGCLDLATNRDRDGHVSINCGSRSYDNFIDCISIRIPNAYGDCYYSRWLQLIVDRSRDVECAGPVPEPTPEPGNGEQNDNVILDYCDANAIRFHVLSGCNRFLMEDLPTGTLSAPQYTAPGTLFDLNICGQNHAAAVSCPV